MQGSDPEIGPAKLHAALALAGSKLILSIFLPLL
jgi:hypothetical protein